MAAAGPPAASRRRRPRSREWSQRSVAIMAPRRAPVDRMVPHMASQHVHERHRAGGDVADALGPHALRAQGREIAADAAALLHGDGRLLQAAKMPEMKSSISPDEAVEKRDIALGADASLDAPAGQEPEVLQDAVEALGPKASGVLRLDGGKRRRHAPPCLGDRALLASPSRRPYWHARRDRRGQSCRARCPALAARPARAEARGVDDIRHGAVATVSPDGLPVESGLGRERGADEAGQVHRAEIAGPVGRQRDLAARIGRADLLAIPEIVEPVDAIDEEDAGLGCIRRWPSRSGPTGRALGPFA